MLNLGETPSPTEDASQDMAAGDGLLIVPAGNHLVAVGSPSVNLLPAPPAGLQATPGDTQVALSWNTSAAATSYNVYRATSTGGEGATPIATGVTSNSFAATGLTNGTTYYFEVTAVGGGGESGKSSEASAMPMLPVTSNSSDAVAYRSNPAHTGQATMPTFGSSPTVSWDVNLPSAVSYPLIAGGKVFVLTVPTSTSPRNLYALNAATGSVLWGPVALPTGTYVNYGAGLAYENGTVFITMNQPNTEFGLMLAYDAATGALDWSTSYTGQWWGRDGPTALNGFVYTQESGNVSCIRETDGTVMWTTSQLETEFGDLAVTANGLFISGACGQTYSLDPATGSIRWHLSTGCSGGGGYTPAYYSGKVYVNDFYSSTSLFNQSAVVDATTGSLIYTYASAGPLAFDNGLMFGVNNNQIIATNTSNGISTWTVNSAADHPVTAPTVVNGVVYLGTTAGYLKGYDENTGALVTTLNLGETPTAIYDAMVDMAAGDGMIVIPAGTHLVAVVATPVATPPDAPTGLAVTAGNAQVSLSWAASAGATSYNVKRSTTSGGPYGTVFSPATNSYTNAGLTNGTLYYFVVSAVNGSGESGNSTQVSATPTAPAATVPFDINGDGKNDLVLQSASTNQVAAWFMNGATVMGGHNISMTPGQGWTVAGEGDFNGDGKPDLVLQNAALGKAAIWYLTGITLMSGQYVSAAIPSGWTIAGVGDFNGDGKPDLVLQSAATNKVAFWYLNGASVQSGAYAAQTPASGWTVAGAGDFNGDGKTDLVLQNSSTRQVAFWYMNGPTLLSGQYLASTMPLGWHIAGVADFDADGKSDLVLQNAATGQMAFWYLNGAVVSHGAYVSLTPSSEWRAVSPR